MTYTELDSITDASAGDQGTNTPPGPAFLNRKRKLRISLGPNQDATPGAGSDGQANGSVGAGWDGTGWTGNGDVIKPKPESITPPFSSQSAETKAKVGDGSAPGLDLTEGKAALPPVTPDTEPKPQLAKQGSSNPIIRAVQRATGMVGPTPAPGEEYTGPTTPEERSQRSAALSHIFKGVGDIGLALRAGGGGMPQQTQAMQILEEEPKLELQRANITNEMQHRLALEHLGEERIGVSQENAETSKGRLGVSQQRADTADSVAQVQARAKGQIIQKDGSVRPMTSDEVLADPVLSNNPNVNGAATAAKQAETALAQARRDALMNPSNPTMKLRAQEIESRLAIAKANLGARLSALSMHGLEAEWNFGLDPLTGERLGENPDHTPTGMVQNPQGGAVPYRQQSLYGPTTQMRNIGQQSKIASEGIPGVIQEVSTLSDKMGPLLGRWNEFIQGRVGLNDPDFAGLRSDLMLLSSAVALAHARGRLPENLREEFDQMINAPQQSAANIISVVSHIKPWMDRMAAEGNVREFQGGQQAAPTPTVAPASAPKSAPKSPAHAAVNSTKPQIHLE